MALAWKSGSLAVCAVLVLSGPAWAVGADSQLVVQVEADRSVYQTGDNVELKVRTFLDGQPTPATLVAATLSITLPDGKVIHKDIRRDFKRVGPGVYAARGVVDGPGQRELEVRALLKKRVTCRCRVVAFKSTGVALFNVEAAALEVGLGAQPSHPTVCEVVKVALSLNRPARVRLLAVYPHGPTRDLVIPGWLGAGEHWIKLRPGKLELGPVTLKAVVVDRYGQQASATVELTVEAGVCQSDC